MSVEVFRIEPAAAGRSARPALLRVPAAGDPAQPRPLAVMLHGAGGDPPQGLDLLSPWAEQAGVLVLAPASAGITWDTVRGEPGEDWQAIERALDWVDRHHALDRAALAIGGFSDGGSCALALGLAHGELFGRLLAFSPGFVPHTVPQGRPAVFIAHGTHDTVLPISRCSRIIVPRLRALGYTVDYREFTGGHVVPPAAAREAVAWWRQGNGAHAGQSGDADSRKGAVRHPV